jgi:F0F1-type ATP synthase membrane subunit c/vacuolar-type H+-ATPase subunit K
MNDLKKAHQMAFILNAAIIGTLIIYAIVVEIIRRKFAPFMGFGGLSDITLIRYLFYGIVVVNIFVIRILRNMMLRKSFSDDTQILIRKLLRSAVITAALCEVPALLGLLLFLLAGSIRDFYQLAGLSFILVFLHFPRYGNWEDWTKNAGKSIPSCG